MSRSRPPRHVRFDLPPASASRSPPRSILRPPPPHYRRQSAPSSSSSHYRPSSPHRRSPGPTSPPNPTRRSSLPDMRPSNRLLNERRLHALESLHDMRSYLKEACNFHGEDSRRAITVLSLDALSALISFVNALRADMDATPTRRDEILLRSMVDPTLRHPHEQLNPVENPNMSKHERKSRKAHKKRMRLEAEFRLLQFVSKQLTISMRVLQDLPPAQLMQRELDAFKSRLRRFNERHHTIQNSSVPNSPADRPMVTPHGSHTDPIGARRAYEMPHATVDELFPGMEELNLPGSSFDLGRPEGATQNAPSRTSDAVRNRPYAAPGHGSPYMQPVGGSPYHSPYAGMAPSPYARGNSPYGGMAGMPSPQGYTASGSQGFVGSQGPSTPTQTYSQPVYRPGTPTQTYGHPGYTAGSSTQGYGQSGYSGAGSTQNYVHVPPPVVTNYPGTPPPVPPGASSGGYTQGGWQGSTVPGTKVFGANVEHAKR